MELPQPLLALRGERRPGLFWGSAWSLGLCFQPKSCYNGLHIHICWTSMLPHSCMAGPNKSQPLIYHQAGPNPKSDQSPTPQKSEWLEPLFVLNQIFLDPPVPLGFGHGRVGPHMAPPPRARLLRRCPVPVFGFGVAEDVPGAAEKQ